MKRLLVVGIGSPNPGDELGWQALLALRDSGLDVPGFSIEWREIEHPAVDLMPAMQGVDALVLLDAMPPDPALAEVQPLSLEQLALQADRSSSHGVSVADTLRLAERLQLLPGRLLILGLQGAGGHSATIACLVSELLAD